MNYRPLFLGSLPWYDFPHVPRVGVEVRQGVLPLVHVKRFRAKQLRRPHWLPDTLWTVECNMRGSSKTAKCEGWAAAVVRACYRWIVGCPVSDLGGVADLDDMGRPISEGDWDLASVHGSWCVEGRVARSGRRYVCLLLWEDAYRPSGRHREVAERGDGRLEEQGLPFQEEVIVELDTGTDET